MWYPGRIHPLHPPSIDFQERYHTAICIKGHIGNKIALIFDLIYFSLQAEKPQGKGQKKNEGKSLLRKTWHQLVVQAESFSGRCCLQHHRRIVKYLSEIIGVVASSGHDAPQKKFRYHKIGPIHAPLKSLLAGKIDIFNILYI